MIMKRSLVIGASGGIGAALAAQLEGDVVTLSRSADGFDVCHTERAQQQLAAIDGPFDRVIVALGVLAPTGHAPEKSVAAIDPATMAEVMAVNAIGPAMVLREVPRWLPKTGRSVVAVLSARVGSIGDNRIGGWHSYRASKAALNQIIRGTAIELARTHKEALCIALHPGTVETSFTAKYAGRHKMMPAPAAAASLLSVMDELGADQSGGFFDYAGVPVPW